jgi:hypothetical protein
MVYCGRRLAVIRQTLKNAVLGKMQRLESGGIIAVTNRVPVLDHKLTLLAQIAADLIATPDFRGFQDFALIITTLDSPWHHHSSLVRRGKEIIEIIS